jgi:hypothetical protein
MRTIFQIHIHLASTNMLSALYLNSCINMNFEFIGLNAPPSHRRVRTKEVVSRRDLQINMEPHPLEEGNGILHTSQFYIW